VSNFPPAHKLDILVVDVIRNGTAHQQFDIQRQVYSTNGVDRLRGRKLRRVWIGETAHLGRRHDEFMATVTRAARMFGGEILPIADYAAWQERDAAVAEQQAIAELDKVAVAGVPAL
jgi:hypothetical protein